MFYSSESQSFASSISALLSPTDYETWFSLKPSHSFDSLSKAATLLSSFITPMPCAHTTPYAAPCLAQTPPPLSSQPPLVQLQCLHQPHLQKDQTNSTMYLTSKKKAATLPSGSTGSKWSSNSENSGHSLMVQIRLPAPPPLTMQIGYLETMKHTHR